ncbi:hypothetical protein M9434_002668 [Picochlorum sp. BPE23]|nr:hypothetical protein M9434_002668 [Picochlorum sp. BPE23]
MNRSNSSLHINLEVFVNKQLDEIERQAAGTSNKDKIIRQSCCSVKRIVSDYGSVSPPVPDHEKEDSTFGSQAVHGASGGLPEEVTVPLLSLLKSCLETKNERVIEPALSCLHKLIAYMYLQGETRASGRLDDAGNIVTTVVLMAAKAASTPFSNHSVQLTAVKTLLTATTAEYFIPHGDCLMLAVRTAFNIAINGATKDVQNAAASALLQMLNTLLKRVANQVITPSGTPIKSHGSDTYIKDSSSPLEKHQSAGFGDDGALGIGEGPVTIADKRAAKLSQLAEQSDIRGLEEALTSSIPSPIKPLKNLQVKTSSKEEQHLLKEREKIDRTPGSSEMPSLRRVDTPPDPRRALMRDLRASEWKALTTPEKDFVIVLSAMCKMASRETGSGAAGTYYHTGKLFALDTVVKVLTNPMHEWDYIRTELAIQLRQPLCLAILRNCKSPYESAIAGSVNILCAILNASPLRSTLRAEIGALYPLIILRPLENGGVNHSGMQKHAIAALHGLEKICAHPQVLVDIFVNFDCSMQASNLFERTVNSLAREASNPPKQFPQGWSVAKSSLLKCIDSLDTWAGPLKPWLNDASNLEEEASIEEVLPGRDQDVLRQIHLDKAKKSSLQEGLAYFNQDPIKGVDYLLDSNVIESDPDSIAQFLIGHDSKLDPEAVGELLGHHDERSIKIMHAFVRKLDFSGLTVDAALRVLLRGFRLPGEAQKIDRIMEKFAEKYCEDNPNVFPVADAAYLLSFAVIMLNTDAHNPMAERRIQGDDFVTMCTYQTEAGEYEQIMPTNELLDLYTRIVDEEIAVPKSFKSFSANQRSRNRSLRRLAAATGLSKLVAPFHPGNSWDKQYGADQERMEMDKLSMQISTFSSAVSEKEMWKTATHAEHARPMLQVAGDPICKSLIMNLRAANSVAEAMPILKGFEQAIKLCALLWLENLTLQFVKGLALSSGFGQVNNDFSIAQSAYPGTPEEAKNVACLSRLVSLACSKEAGLLGGAWIVIFKVLSGLEKLKERLSPEVENPLPSNLHLKWMPRSFSNKQQASKIGSHEPRKGPTRTVIRDSQGPLIIREEPGMGVVIWAETSGAASIERIFANSTELDGESILTFMRALCAISQEELEHTGGSSTRIYLLQRVVECSYFNAGRIRLVWQKIWTVVSQHLVSAACCPDTYVAMFAVDSLRQLADKLLCRTELPGFSSQGEAIRPLGSVIRCSDSTAVRELSIACIAHIVDSHHERIAGGWWAVIDALAISASDTSTEVITQSIDIMRGVFKLLFLDSREGAGHDLLEECVHAAVTVVTNQSYEEDTAPATASLELFQMLCQKLYESKTERQVIQRWISVLSPLAAISRSDPRPEVADTASTVLFYALTTYGDCFDRDMWENIFEVVISPVLSVCPTPISQDLIEMIVPNAQYAEHPVSFKESKDVLKFYTEYNAPVQHIKPWTRESSLRIVRLANSHLPSLWDTMSSCPMASHLAVDFLKILWSYSIFQDEIIAEISETLCERMFSMVCSSVPPGSWKDISRVFATWLSLPDIDELVPSRAEDELRRRCNSVIKGFNLIAWVLMNCTLPQEFVWGIVQVMQSSLEAIRALNDDHSARVRLEKLLSSPASSRKPDAHDESPTRAEHAANRFESLADAVVDTVQRTDDKFLPAFSRVETLGEKAFADSIMHVAKENLAGIEKQDELYSMLVDCIVQKVHQSCGRLEQIENYHNSDTFWLETERISSGASLLLYLTDIPEKYWENKKNDMMKCASQMVRFQNNGVRKAISVFFQKLAGKP